MMAFEKTLISSAASVARDEARKHDQDRRPAGVRRWPSHNVLNPARKTNESPAIQGLRERRDRRRRRRGTG